ncbi:MAG: hypothetical protein ACREJ0_02800 [Geminicoccaceae bacterium]
MSLIRPAGLVRTALLVAILCSPVLQNVRADELVEWLFWNEIGNAVGTAAQSYADYAGERQLWRENIAAAKAELARCGGCASAQAELDKWQGIENRFREVAGNLALATGMPPSVAKFLDIDIPLAPLRSAEERARECEIVRRDWVGQRSEFCQSKVDEYLSCLRGFEGRTGVCTAEAAKVPGGECWEQFSFYEPCRTEDYAAVERERQKEEARLAGAIIPDHARYATSAIVVYGRVPDDFLPQLPPADVVVGTLDEEQTREVKFRMRKERAGALRQITVKYFHWSDVEPQSRCFDSGRSTEEIALRICEDLIEMSFRHHPPLLTCEYVSQRAGLTGDAIYWYGSRPKTPLAEPAHLLQRSQAHPLLQIGEPRTDCPASLEEAKELYARYRGALANLGVEQVPSSVTLRSPSDWRQERQAEHDARGALIKRGKAALADFPLLGTYKFEVSGTWGSIEGECALSEDNRGPGASASSHILSCVDANGGRHSHPASLVGDQFSVWWRPSQDRSHIATVFYMVDLDDRSKGQDALVSYLSDSRSTRGGRLTRTGDVEVAAGKPAALPAADARPDRTGRPAPATSRDVAALGPQRAPAGRSSTPAEPAIPAPPDRRADGNRGSTGGACTVEMIAGTYRTTWGDIVCKPAGPVLECCHGAARCQKTLYLELMPDGRHLVGRWEQWNGVEGPAEFGITDTCDLTHGRWGNPQKPANRAWNVAGRK